MDANNKRALHFAEPLPRSLIQSETLQIDLDKALRCAPKPRPIKFKWTLTSTADAILVDRVTDLLREKSQLQRFNYSKHRAVVNMVLANLIYAAKHSAQVLYSRRKESDKRQLRNPDNIDNRLVIRVMDFLAAENFIQNHVGASNEYQSIRSWCMATPKLMNIVDELRLSFGLSKKTPLIELRDAQKHEQAISNNRAIQLKAKARRKPVGAFNGFWLDHAASIPTGAIQAAPIIPYLHRIFNLDLDHGGRFYGDYQTLSKLNRARIQIDREPTIELDYSALHVNLLYAIEGVQFVGDGNNIEGLYRELAKSLIVRLLNSGNIGAFKSNVTRSGDPATKRAWQEWQNLKLQKKWISSHVAEFRDPDFLEGFIEDVPDGLTGEQAFELICKTHHPIAHHFGSENIGLKLQFMDSQIMADCLQKSIEKGLPVLPVHDSLICKESHEEQVKQIMLSCYSKATGGFKIQVK